MYAVQRLSSYISHGVYTVSGPFHPFGGAVDIIVVQQPDGSFKSSPWYVRFGKFQGVLKTKEKVVDISVNGTEAGFRMYLDHKGEAYFLREIDGDEGDGTFSPPSSGDEMDERSPDGRLLKAQSLNLVVGDSKSDTQNDMDSRNAVKRTSSQPSSLLGLVFRQKSTKTENTLGNGASEEGISTPDGVAISEDILDAKCSISRLADNEGADNASLLSGIVKVDEEADEDVQVSHHGFIQPTAHETVTTDVSSGLAIMDTQYSDEVTSPMHKRLSTHKQDLRLSASDMSELSYKHGAEQSTSINKGVSGVENAGFNQIANGLTSDATVVGSQGHGFADLEEGHTSNSNISTQGDMGLTPGERGSLLVAHVSEEESYDSGVSSYVYRETSVNMSLGIEGQCKEVEVHTEVLCKEAELISNRISQTESGLPFEEENPEGECHNPNGDHESDGISENSILKIADLGQMRTKSPYIDQLSSGPVESNIAEVIHQDTILIKETNLESGQIEAFENRSQMKDHSPPCLSGNNEVGDETSSPDSFDRTVEDEWMVDSVKEDETRPACISNTINQVQEGEDLGQVVKTQDFQLSFEASINSQESNIGSIPEKGITYGMQSTENLEEDDYLFNDLDNLAVSGSQSNEADSAAVEEIDHHMMESIEEEHELSTTNHESCLSSNRSFGSRSYSTAGSHTSELIQESSPTALEGSPRESGSRTNPITIPRSRLRETVVESVPNFLGHMHELGSYDILQPRSRSLDLGSTHSKWDLHRQSLISKAASESNLVEQHPTAEPAVAAIDNKSMEPHECLSLNLAVEISLCKHLLFEGMGAAAAAEAFDSEKVDLERFSTMGPSLVKNDKLVVRVGGRYFPWSAAAPIVLGMVCFGNEQILKPEGMISVDKSEKDVEGEAIVSSGGSWRLWPFSFRKSKAGNSVQLASKGNNGSEADNIASQIAGDNELNQGSTVKKLVRSEIPTSEQLASLDLKEGQNLITFTFSTAMLGKQQVDARIYLWKWNTRIVISDVDGTITKSDVLGQFMPLVGKDWSQSGVANLFSAIKENGYQLLFLSARAISQAYLTRQFLVNLKQDGKALPDGPVVISPDGLFPSLFREVIRRAPHEFKISCLEDIRALFPPDCNPFYAGFGNRDTDEISYLKVGIPKGKIFIINPKGEVAVDRWVDTKSYTSLHSLVNGIFPAMSSAEQEDFNSWNFWKMPLPKIDI